MTKGDFPALRMKIERGHLVPAGPFDQERLNSYRNGAIVMCRFTEERDRVLVRKWWAILGLVLKQCQTPWKNKDEAHEAIKLALGIVNLSKTVGGDFMAYPKSLADLDDPEMTDALENMTELLSRMTGVDVATLKKETAHIHEEAHDPDTGEIIEHESGERPLAGTADEPPHIHSSAGATEESSDSVAPTNTDASDKDGGLASEQSGGGVSSSPSSPAGSSLDAKTRAQLIEAATKFMKLAQEPISFESRLAFLESRELDWREVINEAHWPKLESIASAARHVINSKRTPQQAFKHIAVDLLDCTVAEVGG